MNSTPTVLWSRQNIIRRYPDEDISTFYAIELFVVAALLDAVLVAFAAPVIPDLASLYITVT